MKVANDNLNATPNMLHKSRFTPSQLFSTSSINDNPNHFHPFGSPVYVLAQPLQQKLPFSKWSKRAKRGLYLGTSPHHARNISLVLDLQTGLVSPQMHVAHDNNFLTVKDDDTKYNWSIKAGFQSTSTNTQPKRSTTPLQRRSKRQKHTNGTNTASPSNPPRVPQSNATMGKNMSSTAVGSSQTRSNTLNPVTNDTTMRVPTPTTRPKRLPKPVQRLITAMTAELSLPSEGGIEGEIFSLHSLFPDHEENSTSNPLLAYKSTSDPDTLYYHQAMKQPDREEFQKAMHREMKDNFDCKNFEIIHKSRIKNDATILPSVWQLRRKRHILTQKIKKYKARINVDGSKMIKDKHYTQTYAPVASWALIRMILVIAAIHKWPTKQIDYVMAFPQAPIERELYMELPKGYKIKGYDRKEYALKLNNNMYGQKQAGRVWNKFLVTKLKKVGFVQSKFDECIFYHKNVIYILYTDDSIITGPTTNEINDAIKAIKSADLQITEEGDISDFLGVNITNHQDGSIHFHQPHLIDQILTDLKMNYNDVKGKSIPAQSSKILSRHSNSTPHDQSFNYKSILGKLGYLEKGSRPEIAYIVHQCARFSTSPKTEHSKAIRWLARYLHSTKDQGMIFQPDTSKGLELYVDADFAGNWNPEETQDVDTARSRHGFAIKYAGCLIVWKSQLQREIALSSTEAEYTGLSYAIREVIPIMNIIKEISQRHKIPMHQPKLQLKVFEDNAGAIEIATNHKYRPRTKHLNIRLHHFRKFICNGAIKIFTIHTDDQEADIFTKPLAESQFLKLRKKLLNW